MQSKSQNKTIKSKNQHTGSTLSQLLYFGMKSVLITWPQTEVILNLTFWELNIPSYSNTLHAELRPLRCFICPFDKICAND